MIAVNPAIELSVSIVLYRSDINQLASTINHLRISAESAEIPLEVAIIDQSQRPSYSHQIEHLCTRLSCKAFKLSHRITSSNKGYGGGHNVALTMGLGRYHLILNPDVELSKRAIKTALDCLSLRPDIALLAPLALDANDCESHIAKRYPTVLALFARAFWPAGLRRKVQSQLNHYEMRDLARHPPLQKIPLASGCCMFLRSSVLASIHGFDERYFMYFEDFDLTLRAASLGETVRHADVVIHHYGGNAAGKSFLHQYWFVRSAWLFFSKWGWRFT